MTGTLSILGHFALTLFDSGSTHSFISTNFVSQAGIVLEPLLHDCLVGTPAGVDMVSAYRVKDGHVVISGVSLGVDLMVVDMTVYDVILGMDWLAEHHASIDCHKKEVTFTPPSRTRFRFKGTSLGTMPKVISMMKAKKLVRHGAWAMLASVARIKEEGVPLTELPIVSESQMCSQRTCRGLPHPEMSTSL